MRVSRVDFEGFRRLARTGTSIDGALTAFVGFNEAGKTSVLRALAWFTAGGQVASVDCNRSRPPTNDGTPVVKVFFELDESDKATFTGLAMDSRPTTLVLSRKRDGNRIRCLQPSPTRPAKPFRDSGERLAQAVKTFARQLDDAADEETPDPNDWAARVVEALKKPDAEWSSESTDALAELASWFREPPPGRKRPRDSKLAILLDQVRELVMEDHPTEAVWNALSSREPDFVLFQEVDRLLETSYEINPDQRAAVHAAVTRLLALAGIDLDEMWTHIQNGDSTRRETVLERGNDQLRALFDQAWNQSKVTVRFNVNGTRLEVLIKELDGDGDVTNISERSDGLKTFVALVRLSRISWNLRWRSPA